MRGLKLEGLAAVIWPSLILITQAQSPCDSVDDEDKTDCGYYGIKRLECESNGCCWVPSSRSNVPWCYHTAGGPQTTPLPTTTPRQYYTTPRPSSREIEDLRLVGGSGPHEGRLEIRVSGQWGTVCDDGFEDGYGRQNARVVCRMLGRRGGESRTDTDFGEGSGTIWLDDVECHGGEQSIGKCRHRGFGRNNCRHSEDVGIVCEGGPTGTPTPGPWTSAPGGLGVRLVGGSSELEGRLEIYYNNEWGTVCDDGFEHGYATENAQVICRMMGMTGGEARTETQFGEGSGIIWLDEVQCDGSETSIDHCQHEPFGIANCGHYEDVGIVCNGYAESTTPDYDYGGSGGAEYVELGDASVPQSTDWLPEPTVESSNATSSEHATEGEVRLVGPTPNAGRLEIFHAGQWGTVCNYRFEGRFATSNVKVVCRMLGYSHGVAMTHTEYGEGTGPMWLDLVECSGAEASIDDCVHWPWGETSCSHGDDVGIVCEDGPEPTPPFAINNNTDLTGVCNNDTWEDKYQKTCSTYSNKLYCTPDGGYGEGWKPEYGTFERYAVDGKDGRSCPQCGCVVESDWPVTTPLFAITNNMDITDGGGGGAGGTGGSIRLVGGQGPHEGRLELFHAGEWGTICDDGFEASFGRKNAQVICRMLGLSGGVAIEDAGFGAGTGSIWLGGLMCQGSESHLSDCYHWPWGEHNCKHYEDVGVVCDAGIPQSTVWLPEPTVDSSNATSTESATEGEVRLVGPTPNAGRLEIFHAGQWGRVCNYRFEGRFATSNTKAVCRMLGYSQGVAMTHTEYGEGIGPMWLDLIECYGAEASIDDCVHWPWGEMSCSHGDDVGIVCEDTGA